LPQTLSEGCGADRRFKTERQEKPRWREPAGLSLDQAVVASPFAPGGYRLVKEPAVKLKQIFRYLFDTVKMANPAVS
jgi:hypothetical protein